MAVMDGTLALIKPEAMPRRAEIEAAILKKGFILVDKKKLRMSRALAEEFYREHRGKPFYEDLVQYMSSGDIMALFLAKEDAVNQWRLLLGPTKVSEAKRTAPQSIRAIFGDPANDSRNAAHGSDSNNSADREIRLLFPEYFDEGLSVEKTVEDMEDDHRAYLSRLVVPLLQEGLTKMFVQKPQDPLLWLALWLRQNNPLQHNPG